MEKMLIRTSNRWPACKKIMNVRTDLDDGEDRVHNIGGQAKVQQPLLADGQTWKPISPTVRLTILPEDTAHYLEPQV